MGEVMGERDFDKVTQVPSAPEADDECGQPTPDADETTGASPGTAQACNDLGLNSLEANLKRLGIKPPGQPS